MYIQSIYILHSCSCSLSPIWSSQNAQPTSKDDLGTLHGLVGHGPFTEASEGQTCSFLPSEEATGNVACRWIFQATRKLASENARHQRMIVCLAFSFLLETERMPRAIAEAKNTTATRNI